eukprot:1229706-Pyramimonas_sp.AAC.1
MREAIATKAGLYYLESRGFPRLLFNAGAWVTDKRADVDNLNIARAAAMREAQGISRQRAK